MNKTPDKGWSPEGPRPWSLPLPDLDPFSAGSTFKALGASLLSRPWLPLSKGLQMTGRQLKLLGQLMLHGGDAVADLLETDRRFSHEAWKKRPHAAMAIGYMVWREAMLDLVEEAPGLDDHTRDKARFFITQTIDMMAPSNTPLLNPQVIQETRKQRGKNLYRGFKSWLSDVRHGSGLPTQSALGVFEVGRNIAVTPGHVVARNELVEVIQYTPQTETVHATPILILPPWINKYYVLDLQQNNSFIHHLVEQGFTVFTLSWKNPDASMSGTTFADYVEKGALFARGVVTEITGEAAPAAIGYCLGGTLLGVVQAALKGRGETPFSSLTFFASMLDFCDPGEISIFIDERAIRHIERKMEKKGFLAGSDMASSFAYLRARELLWSYYVDNYMLGKSPRPFDVLFWNSDFTRMPAKMHSWYLRNMYLHNRLRVPGELDINGTPIDLSSITEDVYVVSPERDHIAPSETVFRIHGLVRGAVRFIHAYSGHILGVINPPARNRGYHYVADTQAPAHLSLEDWRADAERHEGSWWVDHVAWLRARCGEQISPPETGCEAHSPLCDAPGTYVKE